MSKRLILCVMAGLAGLALATGDAAAAIHKVARKPAKPVVATPHKPQFRFRAAKPHNPINTQLNTHQRFHKLAKTPGHKPGFRKHFGAAPIHPHGNQNAGPVTNPPTVKPPTVKAPHVPFKSGPTKIGTPKKITFPIIKLTNGKGWPIWKAGPKKIWVGGKWKVFVPFASIPVVLIGGGYYWPDAYVNVGRPYCEGITPDGCHLNWQLVRFEDGGGAYQCVHYCPRPNAPPPAQAAALVAPPPVPQSGACEVTIYSEPNFAGQDATTGDEQPALSQKGWQDQIASIRVTSGVWDFFSDENFTGNNMRLRPGTYQNLGPDWTKKINSFNCVMTAPPS